MRTKGSGIIQRQILTVLLAGLAMSLSRSPKKHWKIITDELPRELAKCKLRSLEFGLHRLFEDQYIGIKRVGNCYVPFLTALGKEEAGVVDLYSVVVSKPECWDKKYRLVFFDIPERLRKKRNILRYHLKRIGYIEIQKSVFCFPYDSAKEVMQIIEALYLSKYVRYAVVNEISDGSEIARRFNL